MTRRSIARSEMVNRLNTQDVDRCARAVPALALDQMRGGVERIWSTAKRSQSSITQLFFLAAVIFALSALIIWLAPRPTRALEPGAAH